MWYTICLIADITTKNDHGSLFVGYYEDYSSGLASARAKLYKSQIKILFAYIRFYSDMDE